MYPLLGSLFFSYHRRFVVKFIAMFLVLLWSLPVFSLSLSEFAAPENAGKPNGFIHWHGTGTMVTASNGNQEHFLVSLTMRNLGDHKILFQYHIVSAKWEHNPHLIAHVLDNGFFTIYTSKEKAGRAIADDATVNLANYDVAGWGHSVGSSMYFDYESHGNKGLHHYRSYHDENGNFRMASTGSMGNAEGLQFMWTENLKRIFVHRP